MKFRKYINELALKKSTDFETFLNNSRHYGVKIILDPENYGDFYRFKASNYSYEKFSDDFSSLNADDIKRIEKDIGKDIWAADFWLVTFKTKYDQTQQTDLKDKRKAIQLFAALEKIFMDFIKKKNPELFYFSADTGESSRVKLYDTIGNRIEKKSSYKGMRIKAASDIVYLFRR